MDSIYQRDPLPFGAICTVATSNDLAVCRTNPLSNDLSFAFIRLVSDTRAIEIDSNVREVRVREQASVGGLLLARPWRSSNGARIERGAL